MEPLTGQPSLSDLRLKRIETRQRATLYKELTTNAAWLDLNEHCIKAEIITLTLMMAEKANLTQSETDYYRGAIWAANKLSNVPQTITDKLDSELQYLDALIRSREHEDDKPKSSP